ncbi:MAG TPA: ATP-binding protein [Oligoflexus sp.]|uniref:ATP-binding protein n=1 Tax=Oligoflexus sp. TaxID=1971216 RepID=UPI002D3012AC|nr:ATP-binding protein [Oligoflexus sp.]HYX35996.1 ATP-binding protein [Oligoflexus sp.]
MGRLLYFFIIISCIGASAFGTKALSAASNPWATYEYLDELMLDDPSFALEIIEKQRSSIEAGKDPSAWMVLTLLAAEAASAAERNRLSRDLAMAAQSKAQELGDHKALARSWLLLGSWFEAQDDTQEAEKHFQRALEALQGVNDPFERANLLNRVAYFYNRQALWQQAVRLLTEAFTLVANGPHDELYYDLRNNLGSVYARGDLNRETEGVAWMKEALTYFQDKKQRYMAASILLNLGQYHGDGDKSPEAFAAYEHGLVLVKDLQDPSIRGYLLAARGVQRLRSGDHHEGLRDLQAAQEIFAQGENRFMVGRIGIYLSDGLLKIDKPQDALRELQKAAQSFEGSRALYDKFLIQKRRIKLYRVLSQKMEELAAYRVWEPLYGELLEQQNADQAHRMSAEFDLERKDQLNRLLEVQNQNQALALVQAQKERFYLRLGMVGGAILIMVMGWGLWLGYQVRVQKEHLQDVLDSVQEGILRIGVDRKIFGRYSRHLETILAQKTSLMGHDVLELLLPDKHENQAMTRAALGAILGEDSSAWEFNQSHLPEEIVLGPKVLQLFWRPHLDAHGRVSHLVLVIRDISEQKAYEQSLKLEQERKEARNRKALELRRADFLRVDRYLKRLGTGAIVFTSLRVSAELDQAAMRQLHTWKGEARTLGLASLAQTLHEMEDCLLARSTEAADAVKAQFLQQTQFLWEQLREYQSIVQEYEEVSLAHHHHSLASMVNELLPDVQARLSHAGIAWKGLLIRDEITDWKMDQLELVRPILLHALGNALDHGFIRAPEDFRKNATAFFDVTAHADADFIHLSIRDNGQGILWDKMQVIASEKGLGPLDREGLTQLLFADGVSTAVGTSLSSGRGVGLAAIHEICTKLGGHVSLQDNPDHQGASLEARIPRNRWQQRAG